MHLRTKGNAASYITRTEGGGFVRQCMSGADGCGFSSAIHNEGCRLVLLLYYMTEAKIQGVCSLYDFLLYHMTGAENQ